MSNGVILVQLSVLGVLLLSAACSSQRPEAGAGGAGQASKQLQSMAEEAAKTCGAGRVLEVQHTYFRCK